ncbi:restriction endonuclease subunit S [bacterium]|nr:restriction endonuclease subunit S [bacterium]
MYQKLKGNLEYIKGKKPILIEYEDENSLPYLSAEYLRNNKIEKYVGKNTISIKYYCNNDDLLIIWDGSNSGEVFMGKTGILSSTMAKLKIKDNKYLNKYVYYFLKQNFGILNEKVTGATIPHLNRSVLENLSIYSADKSEQKGIVQVLDTMSEIIRLREECIKHAQDLIPALFQEMFGDSNNNVSNSKIVRFGECIELNPAKPNLANDFNVTFLGMKDVSENGQVDLSTTRTYEEVKKGFTNFENDDVLLAKITPCFENGKAAIVRNLTNGYGFGSTEFYVLRANQNIILPEYVYSIIKSFTFAISGRQKMTGAAGQKRLPKSYILNYKIPLPNLELQIQYAEKLNEINSYIQEQQEELKYANQMFQSLLHHAFTGELTRRAYGKD